MLVNTTSLESLATRWRNGGTLNTAELERLLTNGMYMLSQGEYAQLQRSVRPTPRRRAA
jgi:hypothetical protein